MQRPPPTPRRPTPVSAAVADAPARHNVAPGCPPGLNKYSAAITAPKSQGASQAMLYATGLREEDMGKPQVGGWRGWQPPRAGIGEPAGPLDGGRGPHWGPGVMERRWGVGGAASAA